MQKHRNLLEVFNQKTTGLVKTAEAARENWRTLCQSAGIPDNTSTDTGLALLQERKELLADFDRWKEVSAECKETAVAVHEYERIVSAKALPLGIEADTTEGVEAGLWKALGRALEAQTQHDHLAAQIESRKIELAEAQQAGLW